MDGAQSDLGAREREKLRHELLERGTEKGDHELLRKAHHDFFASYKKMIQYYGSNVVGTTLFSCSSLNFSLLLRIKAW